MPNLNDLLLKLPTKPVAPEPKKSWWRATAPKQVQVIVFGNLNNVQERFDTSFNHEGWYEYKESLVLLEHFETGAWVTTNFGNITAKDFFGNLYYFLALPVEKIQC